jgi:hypothetical protein
MGSFKHIETEIMHWQACGRTVEETYIYWKDYVTLEDVARIFARECDLEENLEIDLDGGLSAINEQETV